MGLITDYEGNYYNNPPSIGAYENNPSNSQLSFKPEILIFPNPATELINVSLDGFSPSTSLILRIIRISGGIVFEDLVNAEDANDDIEIRLNLSSGLYVVQVVSDNTIAGQKFVVVK